MNIKWDTFNPSSLVLGGPSLHSYCLLWFIHRCMRLFDMLSWEVFAPVWGEKSALKTRDGFARQPEWWQTEGRFMLCWCTVCVCVWVCVSFPNRPLCCFDKPCSELGKNILSSIFIHHLLFKTKIGLNDGVAITMLGFHRGCPFLFSFKLCLFVFFPILASSISWDFFSFLHLSDLIRHLPQTPGILSESTF